MESIKFINTNFDPSNSEFMTAAVAMAKAYGYTADLKLDKELAQLIRLRVATVNKCSYCGILHQETARKLNILQAKIDNLGSYWHSELFSKKEKAALEYTDVLNEGTSSNFNEFHLKLTAFFTEEEIAEIAYITINMNLWTRIKLAQGQIPTLK